MAAGIHEARWWLTGGVNVQSQIRSASVNRPDKDVKGGAQFHLFIYSSLKHLHRFLPRVSPAAFETLVNTQQPQCHAEVAPQLGSTVCDETPNLCCFETDTFSFLAFFFCYLVGFFGFFFF